MMISIFLGTDEEGSSYTVKPQGVALAPRGDLRALGHGVRDMLLDLLHRRLGDQRARRHARRSAKQARRTARSRAQDLAGTVREQAEAAKETVLDQAEVIRDRAASLTD